jgi:hypothetical protein
MYKKLFYLIPLMMFVLTCAAQAEVVVTTATGNGADTYLSNDSQGANYGPDTMHGGDTSLRAFRQLAAVRSKAAFIRFDISNAAGDMSGAILTFDATFLKGTSKDVQVYGLTDGDDDFWDESTITYNNAPGILPATLGNYTLDTAKMTLLGTMTVPAAGGTYPVTFSSDPSTLDMTSFLDSDTNGLVTFLFIGTDNEGEIASKEHETFNPPTLTLPNAVIGAETSAIKPNPANGIEDVPRDVILIWTPGEYAVTHNVYLGNSFEDVNAADTTSPLLVGPVQDVNSFNAGRLEFEQTYFWRVDEVNAPPDPTVFKGRVWSFTIEPFAVTIPEGSITATASSQAAGQGPELTINSSGLDANDLHSTETTAMWSTAVGETDPAWIEYEFDQPYKLYEMLVWNYNGESILSLFGIMDVTVEYSMDTITWTQVDGISQFTQASGTEGYAANTTVAFDGVAAKYVRIIPTSIWGSDIFGNTQFGLSEVRFIVIPASARYPSPEDAATDVAVNATLSWRAGREVAEHNVYIGTDEQAVTDGTAPVVTVNQTSNGPLSLDLESTYFWRVDEVNSTEVTPIWEGKIWSFSTQDYLVVEDFESYNDILEGEESNVVYLTWSDGYVDPPAVRTNGSTMGYFEAFEPTMETTIVFGGSQSAPLFYDNTSVSVSEVVVDTTRLAVGRNWTIGSPVTLVLNIYGDPGNNPATDRMYVKVNNSKVVFDGNISRPQWMQWNIDLAALGISLSNVTQLTIGFERIGGTGGSGMVFIDEIRLYRNAPVIPVEEVWVEAETGTVTAPMMYYDDPNASGGRYVSMESGTAAAADTPPYPDGTVTIPFTVEGGTYTARLRVGFPGGDDSCWVRIQDATVQSEVTPLADGWLHFNDMPTGDYWHWSQEVKNEGGTEPPVEFTLSAGTHNLEISYRAAALRIDAVVLSRAE